eukprot:TRINITY_DN1087_c0_g1_i12.p1 TRINITY_DN1087_c0_g1~~TRINITY_DN1087_c0_g1_i12.p1  ORF type:complete len:483 (-),score=13.76 TRINITY_DN1087_c0_g1_i12:51-1439(-)
MATPQPQTTINILEACRVAPPPNSVTETSLPLTSSDVLLLHMQPTQRLFFYDLPHQKTHLKDTILPKLKRSLSLTLQLFYPLAGNLTHSLETGKYEIRYVDDGDSVQLKVAESDADFYQLVQDNPRDAKLLHPLAPELPISKLLPASVLALQVTMLSDSGICIGISANHAVVDGCSFMHFMKSWASVSRSGDTSSVAPLPSYDRTMINQPQGPAQSFSIDSKKSKVERGPLDAKLKGRLNLVRATLVLKQADVDRLRRLVSARPGGGKFRYSTFALTCAYVWVCWAKEHHDAREEEEYFCFVADCRARLDPPLPEAYFGNCICLCMVKMNGRDLLGADGIELASDAISEAIRELGKGVPWGRLSWNSDSFVSPPMDRTISAAGSLLFHVYDTDFGWGRPRKVELISIESEFATVISLAENRDKEEGGVEIGLARPKYIIDRLTSLFEEGLRKQRVTKSGARQ